MKNVEVKKMVVLLVLVSLLTLTIAMPVLAGRGKGREGSQGNSGGRQQSFSLAGTIVAIDNSTITVQTINDRFAGQVLTVQVTSSTQFFTWTPDGRVLITFDEVTVGDSTNIKGAVINGAYVASSVTVDVPLYCQ